jgi:hypothetical protein
MIKKLSLSLALLIFFWLPLHADDDNLLNASTQDNLNKWETHIGMGLNFGVLGLPSQVANALAVKEEYLHTVSEPLGLPFGINFFTGFGYKVSQSSSLGLEFGAGVHMDGGNARVLLGDTLEDGNRIPGYVYDLFYGNYPDARGNGSNFDPFGIAFRALPSTYQWLSTVNTMKGFYLDPKVRVYYRYSKSRWNIQTGVGAGLIIPFNYFAYPSKNPQDYQKGGSTFDLPWELSQMYLLPVRVPFPLMMRDGTNMMKAFQPVADFHVRATLYHVHLEVGYSTNFAYVHHLKLAVGMNLS